MIKILLVVLFAALIIVCGPLASIWALNTLFGLTIAYTFDTWLASLLIMSVIRGDGVSFKK